MNRKYLNLCKIRGGSNFDPSSLTTDELRRIRGAIWTDRLDIPFGPRGIPSTPTNQPDNILAMDALPDYDNPTKLRMCQSYGQDYKHFPTGPMIDVEGYHGKYPTHPKMPTQAEWDSYLDDMQLAYNNKLIPVHFIHPDNWSLEDMDKLEWMYVQPRAKKLLRMVVPTGWEPTRYGWKASYWRAIIDKVKGWMSNPPAPTLFGAHTVTDVDAMTGDGDNFPNGNAGAWEIVAPAIHFWLIQNGPYTQSPSENPSLAKEFGDQFDPNVPHSIAAHLKKGYAGWPTYSAWGPNEPLDLIAAEQTSYEAFWQNLPESVSKAWGDLALSRGADGAFDGCSSK